MSMQERLSQEVAGRTAAEDRARGLEQQIEVMREQLASRTLLSEHASAMERELAREREAHTCHSRG